MANTLKIRLDGTNVKVTPMMLAIDTTNAIASNPSMPYTATEDCFVAGSIGVNSGSINIQLEGKNIFYESTNYPHTSQLYVNAVPKGCTVSRSGSYSSTNLTFYGLK